MQEKKTTVYLNTELHSAVRIAAFKKGITFKSFIESALIEKLKKEGYEWQSEGTGKEQS